MHCVHDKTCKFFLPLSVITQVINLPKGNWRHHLLSNKVVQNSCPLILDNNQSKFSVICVRFMYKYLALCYIFSFFNPTPIVFFKDISCSCTQGSWIVCCLHLKIEFRSCPRRRQRCGIFHYLWWTASIKPKLLFSHAGYASPGLSLFSVLL